jgi:TolB-like protein
MKLLINRKNYLRYSTTDNGQQTTDKKIGGGNLVRKSAHQIAFLLQGMIIIVIVSFNFFAAYAAQPKRIALLPFKINAEKDLSFLQDGIFDMLTTRLSKEGEVEVISRNKVDEALKSVAGSSAINEATARSIGSGLNADFVLYGSLTVLGENVSIDAKMVDISGSKPAMTFFDQSKDLGAVITKINLIAADINDKVFGRTQVAAKSPAAQPQQAQPQQTQPQQTQEKSDIHAHPEKVLQEDGFISQGRQGEADSLTAMPGEARETQQKFWKSANFKYLINGVALGDVDGDGKIETVAATPHSVVIYRSEGGRFQPIAQIDESNNRNLTAVDIADINDNGVAEIFVTSLNSKYTSLNSYVLEYDGKNFVKIIDGTFWYYRVTDTPTRGKILLGQKSRIGKPFSGAIYEMSWQNGEYVPADDVKTPGQTNVMGLTIGDVLNNGQETIVAYRDNDRIRIIDSSGDIVWDSAEPSGRSMLWYNLPRDDRGQVENKKYYPLRLVVRQRKANKESEVITVKNHDASGGKIGYRYLTKTQIEAFRWDGVGLAPSWKTREISGYIQDFIVGDFDNDGQDELIAALIIKEGRVVLTEPKSTLIGYELSTPQNQESQK